jgi:CO/xanthine dehydrogenase FAD-binding subunit
MITVYHRPKNFEDALELLSRSSPVTVPLGGGTILSHHRGDDLEVVDLQALGLKDIENRGNHVDVGATVTLQQLLESSQCPPILAQAIRLETPINLRNMASVAGTLVVCDARSTFATVLLAQDARLKVRLPQAQSVALGEFLLKRAEFRPGFLITNVEIPLAPRLAFEYVARTPADWPIVAVAIAQWPSGRTRVVTGGWGTMPLLAMDGNDASGAEQAAQNALHDASDPWASADYRMDVGATLARRCLSTLESQAST